MKVELYSYWLKYNRGFTQKEKHVFIGLKVTAFYVLYGTLGNLRGGTEKCHMALLGLKGLINDSICNNTFISDHN